MLLIFLFFTLYPATFIGFGTQFITMRSDFSPLMINSADVNQLDLGLLASLTFG